MNERIEKKNLHKSIAHDKRVRAEQGCEPATYNYGDPDPAMGRDPLFTAIWNEIVTWDISVPYAYGGYMEATGNHVAAIIRAIRPVIEQKVSEAVGKTDSEHVAIVRAIADELGRMLGVVKQGNEKVADIRKRLDEVKAGIAEIKAGK